MAAVTRRLAVLPLLLATGALVGGCGGHGANTTAPGATTTTKTQAKAAAKPFQPLAPKAQVKARAFARAVNLRATDVPGFAVSHAQEHHREGANEKRLSRELRECAGRQRESRDLLEAGSGEFERKAGLASQEVSSQVAVQQSAARAAEDLATFRGGRARSCLSRYFAKLLSGLSAHGTRVSKVSTRYGSPPAPGTTGAFGLRVTATLSFRSVQIPFYLDYLVFVDGAAEVSLRSEGTPVPFPARAEERLFSLLVERAKAHSA
jgi:hypothetical protein